jgi:glutamate-1-semialdehyde 2,1-aminomutase
MPQIGTLSGNPIAAIAGLATLEILRRPGAYERIFANGRAVWAGLEQSLKDAGIPALILGEPPMFDAMFTNRSSIIDYRGTLDVDQAMSRRFNDLVRANGVFKSDGKLYISLAHDEQDISVAINAFKVAAAGVTAPL